MPHLPLGTVTARLPVQPDAGDGPFVVLDLPTCATERGHGWQPALCAGCLHAESCAARKAAPVVLPPPPILPPPPTL